MEFLPTNDREIHKLRERERERSGGGSERHYIGGGGGQETISPVFMVPRQCPLVLLV
jgi:hypothetical protein